MSTFILIFGIPFIFFFFIPIVLQIVLLMGRKW